MHGSRTDFHSQPWSPTAWIKHALVERTKRATLERTNIGGTRRPSRSHFASVLGRLPGRHTLNPLLLGLLTGVLTCIHGPVSFAQDTNPPPESATLLGFSGIVETTPPEIEHWQTGTTNQQLTTGARLRTGARSRATLRLSNRSILRVYELSLLQVMPSRQPGHTSILDLKAGATYFFHRDRPTDTHFRTPQASGAIRGTEFNLEVTPEGRTVLTLMDGEVELSNEAGRIHLHSGEQAIVEEGMPPRKTALLETINVIHWTLYYPSKLHLPEL
jgi:hypothetical protein